MPTAGICIERRDFQSSMSQVELSQVEDFPEFLNDTDKMPCEKKQHTSLLISTVNPRLIDYSNPNFFALMILTATIGAFVALLIVSLTNCPETQSINTWHESVVGSLPVQAVFVNSIWSPSDLAEKEEDGIVREVELCILFGRGLQWDTDLAGNRIITDSMCMLPDDAGFKSGGWPITWCPGSEESEHAIYTAQNTNIYCGFTDGTDYDGLSGTTVPFTAMYKVKVTETQKVCPSLANVVGSSLAYVGYLQMIFTGLIGALFIKIFGISKPLKNRASLSGLMKNDPSQYSIDDLEDKLQHQIDELREKLG